MFTLIVDRFQESIASLCQSRNPGDQCELAMKPNCELSNDKFQLVLRIVTKTVPRKNCEYGSGGHSDGGKGYDSAHGHGGGWVDHLHDINHGAIAKVKYRYGHDHGGGYGKGGGGGYDEHRRVGGEQKRGEREYESGSQEVEEYSRLGREAYKDGQREGDERDGEVYSAAQGPGYSYSHHRRREEMEKEGLEEKGVSSDYHLLPPRYQQHRSGGGELSSPQYDLHGGDSFPGYQPLTPSRR